MNKRQLAAIAGLVVSIISILELPAEARRRYGGYRSRSSFQVERSSGRRERRQRTAMRSQRYYQPTSYTLAQIDRSGAPAKAPVKRQRSAPQGDDRFPVANEAPRRSPVASTANQAVSKFEGGEFSHTTLSERQVYRFRTEYAHGQSTQAMHSKLGAPTEIHGDREVWRIARNGNDGKPNGKYGRFVAKYDANGKAYDWHSEW